MPAATSTAPVAGSSVDPAGGRRLLRQRHVRRRHREASQPIVDEHVRDRRAAADETVALSSAASIDVRHERDLASGTMARWPGPDVTEIGR